MAAQPNRREFLTNVGRGMFVAGLGWSGAVDMGFTSRAFAEGPEPRLDFGSLEPLVALMQETAPDKLLPQLTAQLSAGTPLRTLLQAGVLANARSFGGEDYIGFHTLMALGPALAMSEELPSSQAALPVLKVLYRNASRIQDTGGRSAEVLHPVAPLAGDASDVELRTACRALDKPKAEQLLANIAACDADAAFAAVLLEAEDETEVHRVNLAYRAWDLLNIVGREHALTMLRQSLRYCIKSEQRPRFETRTMLAKVFDQFHLDGKPIGTTTLSDTELEALSSSFYRQKPDQAAEAAAAALADGIAPDVIAQAAALAANQLLLRDPGRPQKYSEAKKPAGSVHGDSMGVHSSDAVNAWRNIARVSPPRHQMAAVILAAYQVSRDWGAINWTEKGILQEPIRPYATDLEPLQQFDPAKLLAEAEDAIRHNDQARASAAVHQYGAVSGSERPVFDLLLKYAISEDGALHAEKFYRTVSDEFAHLPTAFRWRQLTGLARVTASEYGYPAPGYAEACRLLQVG